MPAAAVVLDVNVLVQAVVSGHTEFVTWPTLPPTTVNPSADCVGVMNDAREFALWLSPHILSNTVRVLLELGVDPAVAEQYAEVLVDITDGSDGGVLAPARTVHECSDHEDDLILDLAAEVGAVIIVSDDADLTSMSPWRATPILRPREFAQRVDATRRARRR